MIKDVEVIAEARNGQELITLAEELMPEVVMTDISMPGMDGIAAIAHLSKSRPQVRQDTPNRLAPGPAQHITEKDQPHVTSSFSVIT